MIIARSLLIVAILALSGCALGGDPTVQSLPTAVENPAVPTAAPTAQPSPVTENPTAPSVTPTARPSPVAENPTTIVHATPTAGLCQNPYYPVVAGASWTYQMSGPVGDTFTRSIVNVRENGFDDQDVFSAGVTRQGSWECREGNLISLTPASGPSVAAAGMQMNFTVESNTGLTFPADPRPGMEWRQNIVLAGRSEREGQSIEVRGVMDRSCKAVGMERVSVPAGDFEALRVDCSHKMDLSFSGVPVSSMTETNASWYARGVGWVKTRGSSDAGVTEIVLLSYTIP